MIDPLIEKVLKYHPTAKIDLIRRAYAFADAAHVGQKRKVGSSFIDHPVAVANYLADIKVDSYTLSAALLHDVLEHTDITKKDLEEEFGETVAELVDGVTGLKRIATHKGVLAYRENLRKLFLASAKDIRVILIRLADKLHNLETVDALPIEVQHQTLEKILEIYAPLAERLGIFHLKRKLEDGAFKRMYPDVYQQMDNYFVKTYDEREQFIHYMTDELHTLMDINSIESYVYGRIKNYYSIYRKFSRKHTAGETIEDYLDRLQDKQAFRIIVGSLEECYTALGYVHQRWRSNPKGFDDYIARPKPNGYRSVHTSVFVPERNDHAEVQIRTREMHQYNEFGPAAHVIYKELGHSMTEAPEDRIKWLRDLVEWQSEILEDHEFEAALKLDLFGDRVFVFTPKGDVKDMPKGATPIDFAYQVHTEIGHHLSGAKVNGKMVGIDYELQNNDVCEIIISPTRKYPSSDWLRIAKMNSTKNRIRKYLTEHHIL
ncbi:bifunctional (p)ppGpp synthetase/guanosine-3',5'-bis(diphosphate) 3'-pyrophosphohydrolase [candidate division WWE3 bacterium]|nr:bifunctional (p)ppGpp synthetase/guanosine-3',5'-bis(diphosphate) 3'-pyrophosphohydrolase [candidate division WWE3 bacterium]